MLRLNLQRNTAELSMANISLKTAPFPECENAFSESSRKRTLT